MKLRNLMMALMVLAMGSGVYAEDGWEANSEYNKLFNSETLETYSGNVVSVERGVSLMPGMAPGVVVELMTDEKLVLVHVGPEFYTKKYRSAWDLQEGDQVEVIGSEVNFRGGPVLMAVQGTKGDKRVVLRKYNGEPIWNVSTPEFWSH